MPGARARSRRLAPFVVPKTRFFAVLRSWRLLLAGYLFLAVIAAVEEWLLGRTIGPYNYFHYNNYVIYRQSFFHLVKHQDLYTLYRDEHWDYFRYSPTFALVFGTWAWMPDLAGLILWDVLNASVLFLAWKTLPVRDDAVTIAAGWFVVIEMMTALQNSQSNVLIAGLLLLAFGLLERRHVALATLMIALTAFIKVFGLAAFGLVVLYPDKKKFVLFATWWGIVLAALPLAVVSPAQLAVLYGNWLHLLTVDYGQSAGLSVMAWLHSWFHLDPPKYIVSLAGLAVLCWPLTRVQRYRDFMFRLLFFCSMLIWMVIFNHRAESSTYIVAVSGIALWFFSQETSRLNLVLVSAAFVLTCLSPTDIFPRSLSFSFFDPYAIKVVPCIPILGKIAYELVSGNYKPKKLVDPAGLA